MTKDGDGLTAWDCMKINSKNSQYDKIMRTVFEQYDG